MNGPMRMPPAWRAKCVICQRNLARWGDRSEPPGVELRITWDGDNKTEYALRTLNTPGRHEYQSDKFGAAHGLSVYHLCGGGHVFFVRTELVNAKSEAAPRNEKIEMVAILGSIAAGKSYLTIRALNQSLERSYGADVVIVGTRMQNFLEGRPFQLLDNQYGQTVHYGRPLPPTRMGDMLPEIFLRDVHPSLIQQLSVLFGAVMDRSDFEDAAWLSPIRQPVVRRYSIGGATGSELMLGIADLAGELFESAHADTTISAATRHEVTLRMLADFDTLVWVIDPAVSSEFLAWGHSATETLEASTRPEQHRREFQLVQSDREGPQRHLADALADSSVLDTQFGWTQRLFVTVTKSDLIREALGRGHRLAELGEPGAVVDGVASYLRYLIDRAQDPTWQLAAEVSTQLLGRLTMRNPILRQTAVRRLAAAIVEHLEDTENFWHLVHTGAETVIQVPESATEAVDHPAYSIRLSAMDTYLDAALSRAEPGALRLRDVVMSALACGITGGLGFSGKTSAILDQSRRAVVFTLCSPFGGVPRMKAHQIASIESAERTGKFPPVHWRSAGLTHLHLHLLRRSLI